MPSCKSRVVTVLFVVLTICGAIGFSGIKPASAELLIRFQESAPRDRFMIFNEADCGYDDLLLVLNLGTAPTGLIFDTVRGGPGENVAQPLRVIVQGGADANISDVQDGDNVVSISLAHFGAGGRIAITADIDDAQERGLMGRQMVDGSEVAGARISASSKHHPDVAAVFGPDGATRVPISCAPFT